MAVIEPIKECPPGWSREKQDAFSRSMIAWRLRYGYVNASHDHIAAYFGLVPIGIGVCWAWAEVVERRPNFSMLARGKLAFQTVLFSRPWTIYAKCSDLRSKKFAEFLGFTHEGFDGNDYLMRRRPQ